MDTQVHGVLINMAHHHGLSRESALAFFAEIARIQSGSTPRPIKRGQKLRAQKPTINENDPRLHSARFRIRLIEKALERMSRGLDHGLNRKKLRRDGHSESILDVVGHVLTRPDPRTHAEMLSDAVDLLARSGEIERWNSRIVDLPTSDDSLAPIVLDCRSGNSFIGLKSTSTPELDIRFDSNYACGTSRVRILVRDQIPEIMQSAIKERISAGIYGIRSLRDTPDDCRQLEDIEAKNFIDWKGFDGPMKAWLTGFTTREPGGMMDATAEFHIEVRNAWATK